MESPSSETGDNMPTTATDGTPISNEMEENGSEESPVHEYSPRYAI
jgi:hypothetical protein